MTELRPAPLEWVDFPIELIRLIEEMHDIITFESGEDDAPFPFPWDDLLNRVAIAMPSIGLEPWDNYWFPARRTLMRHVSNYLKAGRPEGGVPPCGLWGTPKRDLPVPMTERLKQGVCKHGHPLTPENIYPRKNGRFDCKACRVVNAERRALKKRAEART